ncbi:hypothetical protein [Pseudaestuariivita atlantica]|uniref:Uncharacterized protein n=1 Tax=Pseudaestuariivita atlantica TaxID=1317121 RepID=A0A0L1JL18_9RHOB|nr:hypothetical protein [Pseudaestuariivita atlantica]KNG92118.1 hypothetical protein ATO11_19160 [Pseudaestuariivita atlantica]
MVNSTTFRRLALLGRIKSMRLRIAVQHASRQMAVVAFALLLALGGIGLLMFCLFTLLAAEFGVILGALVSGVLLLVVAGLAIAGAARMKPPAEAAMLDEVEQTLVGEISADLAGIETGLKRIETGTSALFKGDYLTALASFAGSVR